MQSKCHNASAKQVGEGKYICSVCGRECEIMEEDKNVEENKPDSAAPDQESENTSGEEAKVDGEGEAKVSEGESEGESAKAEDTADSEE